MYHSGASSVHQTYSSSGPIRTSIIEGSENVKITQMSVKQKLQNITNVANSNELPMDHLRKHCSLGALLNSSERYDPPCCAESTRQEILEILSVWASSVEMPASIFWLYGAAGAGKSAIAQTFAESLQGKLAASFFFSRTTDSRNNGTTLIPTIVLQLVNRWPGLKIHVEKVIRSGEAMLFSQSREIQARELLVVPLKPFFDTIVENGDPPESLPQVIVIDGLDECKEPSVQCDLIQIIARTIACVPFPLRFLITSRPELHITQTFDHAHDVQSVSSHIQQFDLSKDSTDAELDLYTFLEGKFEEIRTRHILRSHLRLNWPDANAIDTLVQRSSGHFIYAATAMRYIQSPRHRPDERLDIVLGLLPARGGESPYSQLDALYDFIFTGVEDDIETINCALGILHLHSERPEGLFQQRLWRSGRSAIEELLQIEPGNLVLLFVALRSLITVDKDIEISHRSLFDYLLDVNRSGRFHLNLAPCHCAAAKFVFSNRIQDRQCSYKDFELFAHHCRLSQVDGTLMGYLRSFEVVYHQLLPGVLLVDSPSSNSFYSFLRSTFIILELLRRTTPTAYQNVHKHHTETILDHCQTIIQSRPSQTGITPTLVSLLQHLLSFGPRFDGNMEQAHSEKENLESTLRKWRPSSFTVDGNIQHNDKIDNLIKREHDLFSSMVEAWATNDDLLDYHSSLVSGEHFIHGYHYGIQHLHLARPGYIRFEFLLFFTYSRYSHASCFSAVQQKDLFPRGVHRDFVNSSVVLHLAREHLEKAESELSWEI